MNKNEVMYETGFKVECVEDGVIFNCPEGTRLKFNTFGNPASEEGSLGSLVKIGDYIECIPDEDFFVVSKIDSGYDEEQKIDVKKARKWCVIQNQDDEIVAVSAESLGILKLNGLTGFKNCTYVLEKLAQACINRDYMYETSPVGKSKEAVSRMQVNGIRNEDPYTEKLDAGDLAAIMSLGLDRKVVNGIWLPARAVTVENGDYYSRVLVLYRNGIIKDEGLHTSRCAGYIFGITLCYDVFVAANFFNWSKITSGDGTEENPYKLK